MDCSAKWHYRKVLDLPETRTPALALGSAIHEVVAVNMQDKIETRRDLDAPAISSLWRDALPRHLDGVVFAEGESAAELAGCGSALLRVYMDQAAPAIRPAAVELAVEGVIGGVNVHGFVDVLDVEGTVIDLKTAGKKPAGVSASHRLQVSTYAMITPGASGVGRIDTITKTKTVAHYATTFAVTPADRKLTEKLYSITLDQMMSGIVAPNRSSYMCSKRFCSFHETCTAEFGGEVPE
jgi:CRISPR/Cas system-associated exonuclease Cas4 (RecB family)